MKKTLLLLLVLTLAATTGLAVGQPSIYVRSIIAKSPVRISYLKTVPPSGLLLYFSNGTLVYMDVKSGRMWRVQVGGDAAALLAAGGRVFLVEKQGGVYVYTLPTLKPVNSFSILKGSDEEDVSLAAVSADGRYLAASLDIEYQGASVNRLVVYDTATGKRIYLRDPYSTEKLFKVFSVDFSGNYLVVEDIDVLCELCELTDNKVEVYKVGYGEVELVSSLQTGLTTKYVGEGKILLQRVKEEENGLHRTILLSIPGLKLLGETELPQAKSLLLIEGDAYVLARERNGGYRLYRLAQGLRPSSSIHLPLRVNIGKLGRYVVVYKLTSVELYTDSFQLVYSLDIDVPSPDYVPSMIDSSDGISAARYGRNMYVALTFLEEVNLRVRVVAGGKPVAGAHVVVERASGGVAAEGDTGPGGVVVFKLKPGDYIVKASKAGFSESPPVTLFLDGDREVVIGLKEERPTTYELAIHVVGVDGEPLKGAVVELTGSGVEYSLITGSDGKAVFDVVKGRYKLRVEAPGYVPLVREIYVKNDTSVKVTLVKPRIFLRASLEAAGKGRGHVLIVSPNGTVVANLTVGGSVVVEVQRGVYRAEASEKGCTVKPGVFVVNGNKSLTLTLSCKSFTPKNVESQRVLLEKVVSILKSETLRYVEVNVSVKLPILEAPNGTPVDLNSMAGGKILVMEFFYTKCTGCRYLLPTLKRIASLRGVSLVSITVSPADTEQVVDAYRREHGVWWPILRDTVSLYHRLNVTNYPTVAVYYNGRVVFIGVGSKREVEALSEKPEAVLKLISMARAVLGDDMRRLPEILILAGLVLFLASVSSKGGRVAEQEDEGEDKGVLLSADLGDIHSFDSSHGGYLDEDIPLEGSTEKDEYW